MERRFGAGLVLEVSAGKSTQDSFGRTERLYIDIKQGLWEKKQKKVSKSHELFMYVRVHLETQPAHTLQ